VAQISAGAVRAQGGGAALLNLRMVRRRWPGSLLQLSKDAAEARPCMDWQSHCSCMQMRELCMRGPMRATRRSPSYAVRTVHASGSPTHHICPRPCRALLSRYPEALVVPNLLVRRPWAGALDLAVSSRNKRQPLQPRTPPCTAPDLCYSSSLNPPCTLPRPPPTAGGHPLQRLPRGHQLAARQVLRGGAAGDVGRAAARHAVSAGRRAAGWGSFLAGARCGGNRALCAA